MKTLSVREVNENVSRALQEARSQPVLVRHADQPAVWMVSAAEVARAAGWGQAGDGVYEKVLEVVAADLFDTGVLSMGQAARLLGITVNDFIELCDRLEVPVLRESDRSVEEQLDSFEHWLESTRASDAP